MRVLLRNELKRAFLNPAMILVAVIEVVLVGVYMVQEVLPIYNDINPFLYTQVARGKVGGIYGTYYAWIGFNFSQCQHILFTMLPLLAALPYGASLYQDEKKRYVENVLVRCKRSEYYLSKLIVLFVSGGVIAVFPFVLNLLLNPLFLPFERLTPSLNWFTVKDMSAAAELLYHAPMVYVCLYLAVLFVGYGMLNCICFPASYLFVNSYVVMSVPFVLYYASFVVASLFGRYSASIWNYLRFHMMLRDDLGIILLITIILTVVIAASVAARARRNSDILG